MLCITCLIVCLSCSSVLCIICLNVCLCCSSLLCITVHSVQGILPAVSKVFPMAEHRYCIRHIHENMKANANWRDDKIKGLFWNAASATTVPWFDHAMQDIKMVDKKLHDWLKQIPVKHWSRCQFSGKA